jgi:molybdenum cofactor synthesis domain-containing protein
MPQGSDAVVIVEDTESTPHKGDAEEPDIISIFKPVYPGANVSSRGEDILKGSCALKCGTVLTPAKIGVVAALGISEVTVYDKPIVSIIPTGDEIAELGGEITPTQVYDVNSYTLAVLVEQNGGRAVKYPIVSDTYDALRSVIHRAVASSDLVVLSGGSSVGERDVILDVLSELGTVLFHGIQIKPGKPTLCGVVNNKLVWGMPGYPTSCLINGYILLVPVLRALARLPEKRMVKVSARLAHRYASTLGRLEFVPVKLVGNEAVPVFKESGAITSMANADGYFEIPANMDLVEKGDEIVINLF